MTMYVCNFLCALYNIHAPHGKSIFFSAIWYFLCSLRYGSLRIWGSWHMWDLPNKLSFLGFQGFPCSGFHMDLLVLFMVIWTYSLSMLVKSLFWGGHYTTTTDNGSNTRWGSSSFYGSLGFILILCFCSIATYYFGIGCQFSSNFGLWIGEILAVTFG